MSGYIRAAQVVWRIGGFEARDTGIAVATGGLAGVCVVRPVVGRTAKRLGGAHGREFLFLFVLKSALGLEGREPGDNRLEAGDCCVIPAGAPFALSAEPGLEMLDVTLPADLPQSIENP
jgi:hypothetical protein